MTTAIAGPAYPCLWCRQPIVFVQGQGWLHPEGGLYMRRCPNCEWKGAPALEPDLCPSCHGAKVVDHHLATPDRQSPPADPSSLLPVRTRPRSPVPSTATAAAPPREDAFVQDPTAAWTGGWPDRARPAAVVPMPTRVEFVSTDRARGCAVRVVAVRRDGQPHLVHVYDQEGDILPFLQDCTRARLRDEAAAALDIEERELAAVEEARHVGQL